MDVVTAKKSVDGVIKTRSGCRTQENFDLLWSRAIIMADEIKELIDGTDFNFKDAKVPRLQQPSRRLQALIGEMPEVNAEVEYRAAEDHYRITCYYLSIDKIVAELQYRFEGNDQELLLALADIVFNSSQPERILSWYQTSMVSTVSFLAARKTSLRILMLITLILREKTPPKL